jgi:DnaK suppressor protein
MQELTESQLEELVADLKALQEDLRALLDATRDDAKPVDLDLPIGRLSRMDAMQQQSMAKAGREANERRLSLVGAALAMVDEDDYGYCRDCDEPVGYARLKAKPETPFCVQCQSSREGRR